MSVRAVIDRQRWLGAVALAAAVPLPLTGVVSLPFLIPFVAVAVLLVVARTPVRPLPTWAENLLAPAILVAVVAAGGLRFGVLRPVTQLAVAVATVRLIGCAMPGRWRSAAGLLGLAGVAGVASSTHPLLAVYLVAVLASLVTLVGHFSMVASAGARFTRPEALWPPLRATVATVTLAALVAVPLFMLLPRLRSPFAASPLGSRPVSGFRDAVALHRIGDVKLSSAVALRAEFTQAERLDPEWLRLAGATLQRYRSGVWAQSQMQRTPLRAGSARRVELGRLPTEDAPIDVEIVLEKSSDSLFAPLGAVALTLPQEAPVSRGPLGELRVPRNAAIPLSYAVSFVPGRVLSPPAGPDDLDVAPGLEPAAELAREVAGSAPTPVAAALALERFLRERYGYSTSTFAPAREDPVLWFLFRGRSGHCEFFATSMVVMLRALGIPARLQVGYAGGEAVGDGAYVVRDSEAHAWVIAWLAPSWEELDASLGDPASTRGAWQMFDPTPSVGRPGVGALRRAFQLRLTWQRVEQLWDRWVLTFSLSDQFDLLREVVVHARRIVRVVAVAVVGSLAIAVLWGWAGRLWQRRRRSPPQRSTRHPLGAVLARLEAAAKASGVALPANPTPRTLAAVLAEARPELAADVGRLVASHEQAVYAGRPVSLPGLRRVARRTMRGISARRGGRGG